MLTFTKPVTNINGKPVSAYNGAQLSPDGKTLYLNGRNDGADIVVNQTGETTEKLPFSSLTKDDFDIDWSTLVPGITCKKDGVGKPSVVFVRTYDKKEFNYFPHPDVYGIYKVYIRAEEGTLYEGGELQIDEGTRPYKPTSADFRLDLSAGTATYTGPKYFGDVLPQATLKYSATNDLSTATETVPTKAGTYYVWLVVENSQYYNGSSDPLPDGYTVAEKLPFAGFTREDFKPIGNGDGTYTLVCTKADGVGELTVKFECITGVNKGKTFINRDPDIDAYGRYQVTITAKEGTKYKPGSIDLGEYTIRYTPEVTTDFAYDATKNTVEYTGTNYYDADPKMTPLYGTAQSETVPTAPGSYDVYVKVTAGKNYIADADADDDYRIYQVGTYVVPEPTKPKYYYYWNGQEGMERNEGDKITLEAYKQEGYTVTWKVVEGLAEGAYKITDTGTHLKIEFTMPANNVRLESVYEPISYTLTVDGVEEQRAFGKEVTVTASEKEGHTFTGWEVDGVPEGTDTSKATITFTMPANNITLTPQYEKNTYTLTVDGKAEPRTYGEEVTLIARKPVEGKTFTGWKVTGLPDDVDTSKATITFKMPANNVTLTPQYTENTYTLTVNGKPEQRTVGEEVTLTARKPDGMTFKNWEIKAGLSADAVNINGDTITFTMPANDVTISAIYVKDPTPDPDPETKTHKLNVTSAQIFLKDGSDVANLEAVPVGTELKAIAYEDTETGVFKCWTGLDLTEEQSTARVVYFTMPDHDVNLEAVFVTPTKPEPKTYKLDVSYATITLKDGSAVADLTAVPVGTELKATADDDTETSVFKNWSCTGLELTEEQSTARVVEFTMPDHDVNLTAVFGAPTKPDDPTPAPGGDSDGGGAIVMVAVVGGAAVGVGAYVIGTAAYLKSVLPEGMAIPANRQQLAVALWTAAGKPATQSTALFNDVAADAAELQAIRWVVETGLMTAQDGNFKPGSRVGRMEVIRVWKAYQQRG